MSDRSSSIHKHMKIIQKLFVVLASVLIGYLLFFAGFDAAHHWYQSMGLNLLLTVFWIPILFVWTHSGGVDKEIEMLDREVELYADFQEKLEKLDSIRAEEIKAAELAQHALVSYLRVTKGGGKAPTKAQRGKIMAMFHAETGHYMRYLPTSNDTEGEVEISDTPFDEHEGFDKPGGGDTSYHDRTAGRLDREAKAKRDERNAKRRAKRADPKKS